MYVSDANNLVIIHQEIPIVEQEQTISSLESSYEYCISIMAENSKSFSFASRFLPPEQKKSVAALYAFCRLADDVVDENYDIMTVEEINQELDRLKDSVSQMSDCYQCTSTNPILKAFGDTINRHNIPVEYMQELIEGVRMDLNKKEYYTEEELELYAYRVASTVGLMMTHIFMENPAPHTLARAADLGKAMQITNILRDISEDHDMGRIYLPRETREIYGVSEDDLKKDIVSDNLLNLIRYESERANNFYRLADLGIEDLPPKAAFTIKVASRIYGEILNEIKRMDYQILGRRAVVSKLRKIAIALKIRLQYMRKM
ncbi:MAG: phytoene/squalene synthase family protein [Candidatus Odinarchaeota archaeon]